MDSINEFACGYSKANCYNMNTVEVIEGLEKLGFGSSFFYKNSVCFTFENGRYFFYFDKGNMFYSGNTPIEYTTGDLFLNAVNILRQGMPAMIDTNTSGSFIVPINNPFYQQFHEYRLQYEKPTLDLIKAYYQFLLGTGFCEVNAILIVWEFLRFFIADNDELEKEIQGANYNLLYSSLFHSIDRCRDLYRAFDNINYPAPAVMEVQIGLQGKIIYANVGMGSLMAFDRFQLIQGNYEVRTCDTCKKYFVNDKNKKYHSVRCLECRKLSRRQQKSDNDFFVTFDRAYKAMCKRCYSCCPKNGNFREKYKKKYISPCMAEIKSKMADYETRNDLQGFQQFIKQTMAKYKPNKE